MASTFGNTLKVQVFGASHGKAIGVVVDGLPTGELIDLAALQAFLDRRRPGGSKLATQRNEADAPVFLSGIEDGVLTGSPLAAYIANTNARSADYKGFADTPRPSHADFTAQMRYGKSVDLRGGGHFSGRLTAPMCIAGGIALQILEKRGVLVGAHLKQVGSVFDDPLPLHPDKALFAQILSHPLPTIGANASETMAQAILEARDALDSVGGVVECAATGLPAGLGSPIFDGVENRLAAALFGIPAVRGVAFGDGFAAASMKGSEHNDPFCMKDGAVATETNHAGGVLGGITTGMPLVVSVAVKPTASIAREQQTVELATGRAARIAVTGRHDPCIALRAVPVVEAVTAFTLLDLLMEQDHGSY